MTAQELLDQMGDLPSFQMVGIPDTDKLKVLTAAATRGVNRICQYAPDTFDFCQDIATTTSVVNQYTYNLLGNDSDCAEVLAVMYGDSEKLLDHWRRADFEAYVGSQMISREILDVEKWIDYGRKNQSPTIRLIGTPTSAETITYRYRRGNLTLEEFPNDWIWVLMKVSLAELTKVFKDKDGHFITTASEGEAMAAMEEMARTYRRFPAKKEWPLPISEEQKWRNLQRNSKYGY